MDDRVSRHSNNSQRPLIFREDKVTMPEVPCSACGNPTSTQADFCAKCGAPIGLVALADPSVSDMSHAEPMIADPALAEPSTLTSATTNEKQIRVAKKGRIVIGLVAGMVLLVTIGIIVAQKRTPAKAPAIKAEIYYFNSRVIIANHEPVDLSNCAVTITASDTYVFHGAYIPAGKGQIIDAALFINGDSLRFEPNVHAPKHINVSCDTVIGKRSGGRDVDN